MAGPTVIGPRNPVANTISSYQFASDTVAIYVQNYTRFTLLVSFGPTAPTATDSLNNQYDGQMAPGGRDVFYVQSRGASAAERRLNAVGAFTGYVWIMPVDRSGTLALSGTISGINDLWVSAYGPYDPPPPITNGMPLGVDLNSQARMIVLPPPGNQLLGAAWDPSVFSTLGINLFTIPAAIQALGQTSLYIYYLALWPHPNTITAMTIQLQAQPQDSGFANLGSPIVCYRATLVAGLSASAVYSLPVIVQPFFPLATVMALPANSAYLQLNLVKAGGGAITCDVDFAINIDANNAGPPPGYGGNAGSGATRWAGQYTSVAGIW